MAAFVGEASVIASRGQEKSRFAAPTEILNPVNTWKDKDEFDKTARALVGMRLCQVRNQVDADVRAAAPDVRLAAE